MSLSVAGLSPAGRVPEKRKRIEKLGRLVGSMSRHHIALAVDVPYRVKVIGSCRRTSATVTGAAISGDTLRLDQEPSLPFPN